MRFKSEAIFMFRMPLEAFTRDEDFPFFIDYGEHDEPLFLHAHDSYVELVIVLSGSAVHIVDGENYPIRKGNVFVIAEETEHGYDVPENFHICNIMFRKRFLDVTSLDISGTPGFQALFVLEPQCSRTKVFTSYLDLLPDEQLLIEKKIAELHTEYHTKTSGWQTMVRAEFLNLVVTLSRMYDTSRLENDAGIVKLAPALAYIERHFQEEINITELAALTHYSERQFLRLFKQATGYRPVQYITRLRINTACRMLSETELTVAEIAERCGYTDSSYFSRVFMQKLGVSPNAYRKGSAANIMV